MLIYIPTAKVLKQIFTYFYLNRISFQHKFKLKDKLKYFIHSEPHSNYVQCKMWLSNLKTQPCTMERALY